MISLSAKHSCCHLNSSQSETLPNQQVFFFFIVVADKASWKQTRTPELINADPKVPFQGDDLLGRNSSYFVCLRQLVLFWSTMCTLCCCEGDSRQGLGHELPPAVGWQNVALCPALHSSWWPLRWVQLAVCSAHPAWGRLTLSLHYSNSNAI